MKVVFRNKALASLRGITRYIAAKGYPETAYRFVSRLREFGLSLANHPDKFPVCRYPRFASNGFRCAVFERNYVFVYRISDEKLIIYDVLNAKLLS